MNYAKESARYYDLAESEGMAAAIREEQIEHEQRTILETRSQWNPRLRNSERFDHYLRNRVVAELERDDEYQAHIARERHYRRKANAAANQAYLHGHTLVEYEYEEGEADGREGS